MTGWVDSKADPDYVAQDGRSPREMTVHVSGPACHCLPVGMLSQAVNEAGQVIGFAMAFNHEASGPARALTSEGHP